MLFSSAFAAIFGTLLKYKYQRTYDALLAAPVDVEELVTAEALWIALRAGVYGACRCSWRSSSGSTRRGGCCSCPSSGSLAGFGLACFGILIAAIGQIDRQLRLRHQSPVHHAVVPFAGTFFPIDELPQWAQTLALVQPALPLVELVRHAAFGFERSIDLAHVACSLAFGAVMWRLADVAAGEAARSDRPRRYRLGSCPQVFDIEQAVLLLELDPPFGKRDVQLARRRQAKAGTPTSPRPGKQFEHERHLKAINEAADTLERLAEDSRGGRVTRTRSRSPPPPRARRARRPAARLRGGAAPPAPRRPSSGARPVRLAHARPLGRAPLRALPVLPRVGRRHGQRHLLHRRRRRLQQWARVSFHIGVRTVPAGSLQFVDFSRPDPGADRVQRFMTAAKHALAEGDFKLAAQRLVYARDAEPATPPSCA